MRRTNYVVYVDPGLAEALARQASQQLSAVGLVGIKSPPKPSRPGQTEAITPSSTPHTVKCWRVENVAAGYVS